MLKLHLILYLIPLAAADVIIAEEQKGSLQEEKSDLQFELNKSRDKQSRDKQSRDKQSRDNKTQEEIAETIPLTKPGEFLVDMPWTPESYIYQLKYATKEKTFNILSQVPYFALPIDARIISLKVFRKNKTLLREYPPQKLRQRLIELSDLGRNAPIEKRWLPFVQKPAEVDWVQKTTELQSKKESVEVIKPVDEADYDYYENDASRIEKSTSQKINNETLDNFKPEKSSIALQISVGKFDISSELKTNLMKGKSWQIMPRLSYNQTLLKHNQKYFLGFEYGSSQLKLSYLGDVVQSQYRELHVTGALELSETWTIGLVFQSLQIPELSDFTTEIDGTNYGKLRSNSRNGVAFKTDIHFGSESQISLGLNPYIFRGGGHRIQLNGQTPIASRASLMFHIGAGYDYIKTSRKPLCQECLLTNKTTLGQIYVTVNAEKSF